MPAAKQTGTQASRPRSSPSPLRGELMWYNETLPSAVGCLPYVAGAFHVPLELIVYDFIGRNFCSGCDVFMFFFDTLQIKKFLSTNKLVHLISLSANG
ncbi:MAG: hypothetical protein LBQ66_06930 [Planctomycetaceae bacterium]|jgi:hypothetical protein|nr:hypothetical protein [Planctomycetaceae bacterium]